MGGATYNPEIGRVVVRLVFVDMVNHLIRTENPTQPLSGQAAVGVGGAVSHRAFFHTHPIDHAPTETMPPQRSMPKPIDQKGRQLR